MKKRSVEEDPYEEVLKLLPPWRRELWEIMKKAERRIKARRAKELGHNSYEDRQGSEAGLGG